MRGDLQTAAGAACFLQNQPKQTFAAERVSMAVSKGGGVGTALITGASSGIGEALAKHSIAATVTAGADERHGTLARVRLADPARAGEARQLLGAFAVACEVV